MAKVKVMSRVEDSRVAGLTAWPCGRERGGRHPILRKGQSHTVGLLGWSQAAGTQAEGTPCPNPSISNLQATKG